MQKNFFFSCKIFTGLPYLHNLKVKTPSSFFILKKNIVLVYNGFEYITKRDSSIIYKIKEIVGNKMDSSVFKSVKGFYIQDEKTRVVELTIINDSLLIKKRTLHPFGVEPAFPFDSLNREYLFK